MKNIFTSPIKYILSIGIFIAAFAFSTNTVSADTYVYVGVNGNISSTVTIEPLPNEYVPNSSFMVTGSIKSQSSVSEIVNLSAKNNNGASTFIIPNQATNPGEDRITISPGETIYPVAIQFTAPNTPGEYNVVFSTGVDGGGGAGIGVGGTVMKYQDYSFLPSGGGGGMYTGNFYFDYGVCLDSSENPPTDVSFGMEWTDADDGTRYVGSTIVKTDSLPAGCSALLTSDKKAASPAIAPGYYAVPTPIKQPTDICVRSSDPDYLPNSMQVCPPLPPPPDPNDPIGGRCMDPFALNYRQIGPCVY